MLAFELFTWWYGQGWAQLSKKVRQRIVGTSNMFSVPILIQTLFSPWKRIVTYPGASIDAKLRAFGDNMVSRAVGFTVRLLVLLTAAIMLLAVSVAAVVEIVAWPLVPIVAVAMLIKGMIG